MNLQAPLLSETQYQVLRDKPASSVPFQDHSIMCYCGLYGEQVRRGEQMEDLRVMPSSRQFV